MRRTSLAAKPAAKQDANPIYRNIVALALLYTDLRNRPVFFLSTTLSYGVQPYLKLCLLGLLLIPMIVVCIVGCQSVDSTMKPSDLTDIRIFEISDRYVGDAVTVQGHAMASWLYIRDESYEGVGDEALSEALRKAALQSGFKINEKIQELGEKYRKSIKWYLRSPERFLLTDKPGVLDNGMMHLIVPNVTVQLPKDLLPESFMIEANERVVVKGVVRKPTQWRESDTGRYREEGSPEIYARTLIFTRDGQDIVFTDQKNPK